MRKVLKQRPGMRTVIIRSISLLAEYLGIDDTGISYTRATFWRNSKGALMVQAEAITSSDARILIDKFGFVKTHAETGLGTIWDTQDHELKDLFPDGLKGEDLKTVNRILK